MNIQEVLSLLHIQATNEGASTGTTWIAGGGQTFESFSPVDGELIASVSGTNQDAYATVVSKAETAFPEWRQWPAPKRGEVVRQIGRPCANTKNHSDAW